MQAEGGVQQTDPSAVLSRRRASPEASRDSRRSVLRQVVRRSHAPRERHSAQRHINPVPPAACPGANPAELDSQFRVSHREARRTQCKDTALSVDDASGALRSGVRPKSFRWATVGGTSTTRIAAAATLSGSPSATVNDETHDDVAIAPSTKIESRVPTMSRSSAHWRLHIKSAVHLCSLDGMG